MGSTTTIPPYVLQLEMFRILKGIKINIVHNMVYNKCLCTSIIRKPSSPRLFNIIKRKCPDLWYRLQQPSWIKQNIEYNVPEYKCYYSFLALSYDASAVVVLLLLLLRLLSIILSPSSKCFFGYYGYYWPRLRSRSLSSVPAGFANTCF